MNGGGHGVDVLSWWFLSCVSLCVTVSWWRVGVKGLCALPTHIYMRVVSAVPSRVPGSGDGRGGPTSVQDACGVSGVVSCHGHGIVRHDDCCDTAMRGGKGLACMEYIWYERHRYVSVHISG